MLDLLPPETLAHIFGWFEPFDPAWAAVARVSRGIAAVAAYTRAAQPPPGGEVVKRGCRAVEYYAALCGVEMFRGYELDLPARYFRAAMPEVPLSMFADIIKLRPHLIPAAWTPDNIERWDIRGRIWFDQSRITLIDHYYARADNSCEFLVYQSPELIRLLIFAKLIPPTSRVVRLIIDSLVADQSRRLPCGAIIDPILSSEFVTLLFNYACIVENDHAAGIILGLDKLNVCGELAAIVQQRYDKLMRKRSAEYEAALIAERFRVSDSFPNRSSTIFALYVRHLEKANNPVTPRPMPAFCDEMFGVGFDLTARLDRLEAAIDIEELIRIINSNDI